MKVSTANRSLSWQCRDRRLTLGHRTLIMGVLNVTPDSFSDGGRYRDAADAVEHGLRMEAEGADIVDVGGESTRPDSEPVSLEEERDRVLPVVEQLGRQVECLISVDTTKAQIAREAAARGARILNDVSALTQDPDMPAAALETRAGLVLMHRKGTPRTMQKNPTYGNVVAEVIHYLETRLHELTRLGVAPEAIALDPGIGFGKTLEHNLHLLAGLSDLVAVGRPVLVGLSRKRFLGELTGRDAGDRLAASLAGLACSVAGGAHIIRVHDVKESCDAARVVDRILREGT